MFKLVIVEDEKSIFYLLNSSILYEELGLTLVGHALDGQEGLEMILRERPDIVITDITMPVMDGLQLIEAVGKHKLSTRFIIVSGYAQFEFAQRAVSLDVRDYLLKPINADELNHSLAKLISEVSEGKEATEGPAALQMKEGRIKLRNSWLMSLVYQEPEITERTMEEVNSEYMYSFCEGLYLVIEVHLDYCIDTVVGVKRHAVEILEKMTGERLQEICTEYQTVTYRDSVYGVLNGKEGTLTMQNVSGILEGVLAEILNQAGEYTKVCVTAAVGEETRDIKNILLSLRSADTSIKNRIVRGTDRVLLPVQSSLESSRYRIPQFLYNKIAEYTECDRMEELKSVIRETLDDTLQFCRRTGADAEVAIGEVIFRIFVLIREKGNYTDELMDIYRKHRGELESYFRTEDLLREMPDHIVNDIQEFQKENSPETSGIMRHCLSYIEDNFQKQLRLEDVAEQVYISPAYLGVLFKKETGENFTSFLTDVRIRKAKELLLDERINIGEIGYQVGYGNSRYFSRIFKETVGITPKEYRKIHAKRIY